MLKLKLQNTNHTYIIEDIVKNIKVDDKLTTNLESSSSLWDVTLPHDCPYSSHIIEEEDWQAVLYDEDEDHVTESFFTGYLSSSMSWTIDQHGQSALKVTLEDKGVHLLKAPYSKDISPIISGKFSSNATGDLGVVQQICAKAGISCVSNIITEPTEVRCVADKAETCESLLKSVCKEFCYAYSFNTLGQLYLIPLSVSDIPDRTSPDYDPTQDPYEEVHDNAIYDSIQLSKKTVSYKGSRVEWDELDMESQTLVYRDITNQSAIHPDCYIPLNNGATYPSADGVFTYISAADLAHGAEVFSIENVTPTVEWEGISRGTSSVTQYDAKTLSVLVTGTSNGQHVIKLQAKADLTYVKSKNVIYGDGQLATEALREENCRWIHSQAPAKKYANFLAQYDKYCSRTFTFKTPGTYELGDIIYLNEDQHTELGFYLMITRKTRTLTDYDAENKTFSGVWTYEAVSISNFNYNQPVTEESRWIPPSTTYVEVPESIEGTFTLSADRSFLTRDNHSTTNQTLTVNANISGTVGTITLSASYNDGTVFPSQDITVVSASEWLLSNIPIDTQYSSLNIHGVAGTLTYDFSVSFVNKTETVFFGASSSAPSGKKVSGDYYLNTTDGVTYEWNGTQWVTCEDAEKLLESLHAARHQNPPIDFNDPAFRDANTVAWFNTILAAKGIIDSLFSHEITLLDPGYIKSSNYGEPSEEIICEYDLSNVNPGSFSLDEDTFINSTWGYGTYRIECTRAYKSNPQSSEGTDDGEWSIMKDGVQMAVTSDCDGLEYYGISIDFDGEGSTTNTGDYFTIVSSEQTTGGQGFYLGSDGTLRCYSSEVINANATNLVIGGNSSFNGSFNCGVISTNLAGLTPYPYDSSLNERYCKEIVETIENSGLFNADELYPCSVSPNPTRNGVMIPVAFIKYSHPYPDNYFIYFYDDSKTQIDLKTCDGYVTSCEGGDPGRDPLPQLYTNYSNLSGIGWFGGYFTYHPTITILTGGNYLSVNVPAFVDRASVPPGCVFLGPDSSGNGYYPLLVKGGTRTVGVPTTANDASQAYFLATDLINEGIRLNTSYNCQVMNHLSQIVPTIARVAVTEAPSTSGGRYNATVQFYDAGGNAVDLVTQAGLHIQRQNGNNTPTDQTTYSGGLVSDTGVFLTDTSYFCPEGLTVIVEIVV